MKRTAALITIAFWILCLALPPAGAAEKSSEALEQDYQKETNPRKQADVARKLMRQRLEELRTRIGTGVMLEGSSTELAAYQSAIEMLGTAVQKASHTGTSKKAEKDLRDQTRELNDLKITVSAGERPLLDRLLTGVTDLREAILYTLMLPPEESKKEESAQK